MHICRVSKCFISLLIIAAALPFINSANLSAQDNAVLRLVIISDLDGNPVYGANAILFDSEDEENMLNGGVADLDGFIELRNLERTHYFLRVSHVGHETYSRRISISPGERKILSITLSAGVEGFDEIVVEGRRFRAGDAGHRRIEAADFSRVPTPGPGSDLVSYIQSLPGVVTAGDRGGELFIRGGTPYQNYIQVDNLPVIKPFHISNRYSAFPAEMVQNVDLFAGGFSSRYTGSTSAVMDVRLRPGNKRNMRASGAASPYLSAVHLEGPIQRDVDSYLIMGRYSTIDRFASHITGNEAPYRFYDVSGRYSYQGDDLTCNLTGMVTGDEGEINPARASTLSWNNFVLGGRCLGFYDRFNHPVELTAGYTSYSNAETSGGQQERFSAIRQIYLRLDLKEELFNLPVDYGLSVSFRSYETELSGRFTSVQSFQRDIPMVHLYASTEWSPFNRLTFEPGLSSQFTLDTEITIEPRIRMLYQPDGTDTHEISAAAGKYTQVLSAITDERDAGTIFSVLNPTSDRDPLPSAVHAILGYTFRPFSGIKLSAEGFLINRKNIPVSKWTPRAQLNVETTLAEGLTRGFDLLAEFSTSRFYFRTGYGWSLVEYSAVSGDLGAWIEEPIFRYNPPHDQRHSFNALLSYTTGNFSTGIRWQLASGRPYTQVRAFDLFLNLPRQNPVREPGTQYTLFSRPYGERLPYYHRLDITAEQTFSLSGPMSFVLEAGLINVYGRQNVFYFDMNTLERVDQISLLPYVAFTAKFN
jgi:hypothetical protein